MKKLVSMLTVGLMLVMMLCGCGSAVADEETTDDVVTYNTLGYYVYTLLEDGTVQIAKYTGEAEALVIPDTLAEKVVTGIGNFAFESCSSLKAITIPNSVTTIGVSPFYDCTSLTSITVSSDNSNYATIDGVLFCKSDKTLINYPCGKSNDNYQIPDGIISIGNGAFYECSSLIEITIPDSVTTIGDGAFCECSSLTEITIPDSVTTIGECAFQECSSLTEMTIPDSVTTIGAGAFRECSSLIEITIPDSVTTIGICPFYRCTSLTSITVSPDNSNYATIDGVLFCKSDKTLINYPCRKSNDNYQIPDGIISIGAGAFYDCSSLTEITIPDSVAIIDNAAFAYCSSLTEIAIPDSVTTIGDSAFGCCSSLTEITIPDSVTSIGICPFTFCSSLTDIIVSPDNANYATIDGTLFSKADMTLINYPCGKSNESYQIPEDTISIGYAAFSGCSSLTEIIIPNSVTTIGDYAFASCSSLTEITIPDSVKEIGEDAFSNCGNLTLTVTRDSYAAQYAKDNDLQYTYTDSNDWLNN